MSPTFAVLVNQVHRRFHSFITIRFLVVWLTASLGFAVLDFVDPNWKTTSPILSTGLFTYLICRLIVACQSR
ncbi:hypothetical protein N7532_008207 [Penicillium argentinense]|uniref:Uncharacterized protein n=1 Tax=Penicillium argentinense TaxID=1131581 RepID=A0A9W9EWX3_9EURO|nr:uncharacterized protein N7532_008207 [Penicillium argentinense]KAJ5089523.1 hypothetical protein N7532_008207 [Penicillium argentinense]